MNEKIIIIEFGRNAYLIAKKVRKFGGRPKIVPPLISLKEYEGAEGIIISGSPYNIRHFISTILDRKILELGVPILGICFGAQLITVLAEGKVEIVKESAEYGKFEMRVLRETRLFDGLRDKEIVKMKHEDSITRVPPEFVVTARTDRCIAAIEHTKKPIFALQFHPEYTYTRCGDKIFKNFLNICREVKNKNR